MAPHQDKASKTKKWPIIFVVVIAMFIYAILGGIAFHYIESDNEAQVQLVAYQQLDDFLG